MSGAAPTGPTAAQTAGRGPVRATAIAAIVVVLLSVGLAALGALTAALVAVFLAGAAFAFANYASYRLGYDDSILEPGVSSRVAFGSLMLAAVAVVAGLGY